MQISVHACLSRYTPSGVVLTPKKTWGTSEDLRVAKRTAEGEETVIDDDMTLDQFSRDQFAMIFNHYTTSISQISIAATGSKFQQYKMTAMHTVAHTVSLKLLLDLKRGHSVGRVIQNWYLCRTWNNKGKQVCCTHQQFALYVLSLKLSSSIGITVGIATLYLTTFILPSLAIAIRDNKKVAFESAHFSGNQAKIVDARSL